MTDSYPKCKIVQYSAWQCQCLNYTVKHCHIVPHSAWQQVGSTQKCNSGHKTNTIVFLLKPTFAWLNLSKPMQQSISTQCQTVPDSARQYNTVPDSTRQFHNLPLCQTQLVQDGLFLHSQLHSKEEAMPGTLIGFIGSISVTWSSWHNPGRNVLN